MIHGGFNALGAGGDFLGRQQRRVGGQRAASDATSGAGDSGERRRFPKWPTRSQRREENERDVRQAHHQRLAHLRAIIASPGVKNSTAEDVCVAAAQLAELSSCGDAAATEVLVDMLEKGKPEARDHAVAALGAAGLVSDRRLATATQVLLTDFHGEGPLRLRLLQTLALLEPGVEPSEAANLAAAVLQATRDEEPEVRLAAVRAYGGVAHELDPGAGRVLFERLDDSDFRVRTAALATIARLAKRGNEQARWIFLATLRDDDKVEDVRAAAVYGLQHVATRGDMHVISTLCELLDDDAEEGPAVRLASLSALGTLVLLKSAAGSPAAAVVAACNGRAVEMLLEASVDDNPEVRCRALAASARAAGVQDARVQALMLEGCEDQEAAVRRVAAFWCGEVEPLDAAGEIVGALVQRLRDWDSTVRRYAAISLSRVARVGDQVVLRALAERIEDPDWGARSAAFDAMEALASLRDDRRKLAILRRDRATASEEEEEEKEEPGGGKLRRPPPRQPVWRALLDAPPR